MKSVVLFLFLIEAGLILAQLGKNNNGRWIQWLPPPQPNVQVCQRGFGPNPWPKVQHVVLPPPPPSNDVWRPNQGIDSWLNPFYFGYPNYYLPWGYQPQYQSIITRFGRPPLHMPTPMGLPLPLPMPSHLGPVNGQWPTQPQFGPSHGPMPPHMGPQIPPPYFIADRNHYYVK